MCKSKIWWAVTLLRKDYLKIRACIGEMFSLRCKINGLKTENEMNWEKIAVELDVYCSEE